MKKILGLTAMVLLLAGPAFADSSVINYTLEIGGNNHADLYEGGGTPLFTGGQTSLLNLAQGVDVVTWDVRVDVSGLVNVGGVDWPVPGAANLVWTLELYDSTNTLVALGAAPMSCSGAGCLNAQPTDKGFFSTINDGDQDGSRGGLGGPDAQLLAAFAYGWAVSGSEPYARIFDLNGANGPELTRAQYPSAAGFPAGSTAPQGKLVGMGAGYTQFSAMGGGGSQTAGVGVTDTSATCYLGNGPVAEGQISLKNLTGGTYTLKLVPGQGNNVLSIDQCIVGTSGRFAAAATSVTTANGGTVQFVYNPQVVLNPPVLSGGAVSRLGHGSTTKIDYDVVLFSGSTPTSGNVVVEPRRGAGWRVVATFDKPLAGTPTVAVSATGGAAPTLSGAVTVSGNSVIIPLNAPVDKTCVRLDISNVSGADGSTGGAGYVKVSCLQADVNNNRSVNINDINLMSTKSGAAVDATTAKFDINCNGSININDINLASTKSGNAVTGTYP